jgi:hypothetical protein
MADREFINGLLQCHGLYHAWACLEGQANISLARDQLADQFLATDCTTLVFIDGDIGFQRSDLQRLLSSPHSITSGLYPRKRAAAEWVFVAADGAPATIESTAPFPVRRAGTGFLRIERQVFLDLIASGLCTPFMDAGRRLHHFFPTGVENGEYLSEDYFFCELAAKVGHRVFVDPQIRLRHVGRWVFSRGN